MTMNLQIQSDVCCFYLLNLGALDFAQDKIFVKFSATLCLSQVIR